MLLPDVLEKGTWILLGLVVVVTLSITTMAKSGGSSSGTGSKIQEQLDKTPSPSILGGQNAAPAPAPATPSADTTKK